MVIPVLGSTICPREGCIAAVTACSELLLSNESRREILELGYPDFPYNIHHMSRAAKAIYWNHFGLTSEYTWETILVVTTLHDELLITEPHQNIRTLGDILSNFSSSPKLKKLTIIASPDGMNWITVFLSKVVGNVRVLFFEPSGNQHCQELISRIENKLKDYQLEVTTHAQEPYIQNVDSCDTGPICLRYLEMIWEKTGQSEDVSATMKTKSLFQVLEELNMLPQKCKEELVGIRESFQQQCFLHQVISTFSLLISKQSNFEEFKQDLNEFLKEITYPTDVKNDFGTYRDNLKKVSEVESDPRNPRETLLSEIRVAKQALNENDFVRGMKQRGKDLVKNFTEDIGSNILAASQDNGWKQLLAKHELTDILSSVFGILRVCSYSKNISFIRATQELCSLLGLNHLQLDQLLLPQQKQQLQKVENWSLTTSEDINFILQSFSNNLPPRDDEAKTIEETRESLNKLRVIFLEENKEHDVGPETVDQLKTVHEYIYSNSNKWRKASAIEIYKWAGETKEKSPKPNIQEIIAVFDRANEIAPNGKRLNMSQVLSLVIMGSSESTQGKISQIQANEQEKAKIIAMLAIMKILRGEPTIDIITSSPALADKAVRESANFYKLFQIHVATNNTYMIEENTAERRNSLKKYYLAEVVYGTMENFQTDYLQDICGTRRGNRGFGTIILNEVDTMLIEDSASKATLLSAFPGMETLRYVYADIWMSLRSLEDSYPESLRVILLDKACELNAAQDTVFLPERIRRYKDFRIEKKSEVYKNIHSEIKERLKCKLKVPNHLAEFVETSFDKWVDSAILAMYKLRENEDYYLEKSGKGEDFIVIPMYSEGTERTLASSIWSHEMYLFLQLKHNLKLGQDALTTCSISNYGYINLYGENIMAFTKTLGSTAEKELLRKMYNVEFSCIPALKSRGFHEMKGRVISDINWAKAVAVDAFLNSTQKRRAVLLICKSIEDCRDVEDCLKIIENITRQTEDNSNDNSVTCEFRFQKIYETDGSQSSNFVLHPADIVITTDSAIRGVTLCMSEDLKTIQGKQFHICIGFCPRTERQKRRFFTSAGFTDGTVQMIVRLSEIQALNICPEEEETPNIDEDASSESSSFDISGFIEEMNNYDPEQEYDNDTKICSEKTDKPQTKSCLPEEVPEKSIVSVREDEKLTLHEEILQIMDFWNPEPYKRHLFDFEMISGAILENERQYLEKLMNAVVPKLYFEDQLFHQFWSHCQKLYYQNISNITFQFLLKDIQEFWSIWITNRDLTGVVNSVKSIKTDSESEGNQWDALKSKLYEKSKNLLEEFAVTHGMVVLGPRNNPGFQIIPGSSANNYRNPYYGLQEADFHSRRGNTEKALESIENVIKITEYDEIILGTAYMKKFSIIVGEQNSRSSVWENLPAVAPLNKCLLEYLDPKLKKVAKQSLIDARKSAELHLKNLQNFNDLCNQTIPVINENLRENTLFVQLETPELNITEFVNSELLSAQLNTSLINELLKCIDETAGEETASSEANSTSFPNIMKLSSVEWFLKFLQNESKLQLELLGLSLLQDLKGDEHTQKLSFASSARNNIVAGLVALSREPITSCASTFNISVGSTFIFEGLTEILLSRIGKLADADASFKISLINYGLLLLVSLDLEINLQSVKILIAAVKACEFVSSELKSLSRQEPTDEFVHGGPALETLCDFFSKALLTMKYRMDENNRRFRMNELEVIQMQLPLISSLEKTKIVQNIIEERIMERHESRYVNKIFDDAKFTVKNIMRKDIENSKEEIKYVDQTQFLTSIVDAFDNDFELTWHAISEIVTMDIKQKFRNIHDPSNNFFGGYQTLLREYVIRACKTDNLFKVKVNHVPQADQCSIANLDELFQWRVQYVVEELNYFLLHGKERHSFPAEEDLAKDNNVASATPSESERGQYYGQLEEVKRRLEMNKTFHFSQDNLLQQIQLAYMILTAEQEVESECLKNEEAKTAVRISAPSLEKLQKNIKWHRSMQWKYSKCLGGVPSFDCSEFEKQEEQEEIPDNDSSEDSDSDFAASETETCFTETHVALRSAHALKYADGLSRHSSTKRGLEFLSREKNSIGEKLSTFMDVSSQVKVMNDCLKKLEDPLAQLFQSPGHFSRYEVHVDATQVLDVKIEMCELTRSTDDSGNSVHRSTFSKAKCITLILGYRPPQDFYYTKRLFYVESIFPSTEIPDGLTEDVPYSIICK